MKKESGSSNPLEGLADALDTVRQYVVQVRTPDGFGTGFMAAASDKAVGIATAWHVIKHALRSKQPITVVHPATGCSVTLNKKHSPPGQIRMEERLDTALVLFSKGLLPLPDSLPSLAPKGKKLREALEIGWCGYPALAPRTLCFFSGRISAWIESEISYLVDGVAINGVSGGPAFFVGDSDGVAETVVVGLVTAYIPNRAAGECLPGVSWIRSTGVFEPLAKDSQEKRNQKGQTPSPPPP